MNAPFATRMPPITLADTLACLKQAFDHFTNRHVKKRSTPTIVADFGTLLFEQRIADAEAALRGESQPVRIFRVSEVIETLRAKRKSSVSDKSFSGDNSMQVDLARKLDSLPSYRVADGRLLRVIGPVHKSGAEVHLYLDVVEAEVEVTAAKTKRKLVRPASPASDGIVDAFNQLPASERKKYDDAIKAGARVEVTPGRLGNRRVLFVSFLLLVGLTAFARWVAVRYKEARRHEQPSQEVGSTIDVTPPFRIEELRRIRVTPVMYYSLSSSSRFEVCASNGLLVPWVTWKFRRNDKDAVTPPFVILRNNEVYEDRITTYEKEIKDYGVVAGRVYNYAIGKRDPATGNIDIAPSMYSYTVGTCGKRNRDPILGIFPDPPGGTAPLTITFDAMYSDDKPEGGASFGWMFGDGSALRTRARRVTHEYKYGGDYQVSVSVSDSEGGIGNASLRLSLAGPPAPSTPPQEPEMSWNGEQCYVSKVRARTGEEVLLRATPSPIPSGATPVAFRWAFSDCYEIHPMHATYKSVRDMNCFSDPLTTPDFRKRFDSSGSFFVLLEITYDTGETMHHHLGKINVRPNEADYAKRPELRVWYSEPAPTPPEWDRRAKPLGTYR